MENFRSMSCREARMDNNYNNYNDVGPGGPTGMQDLRSYSTSYVHPQPTHNNNNKDSTTRSSHGNGNGNGNGNGVENYRKSSKGSSSMKGWSLSDPELQRKKRVVSYKVYAVQGKMKGSFRKSFKWVKNTCSHVVHGLW